MVSKKGLIMFLAVLFTAGSMMIAAAGPAMEQRSVLSGRVISLPAVGTAVQEGDVLVQVETLTGPMSAARATANGVVTAVMVKSGNNVKIGEVVVLLQAK